MNLKQKLIEIRKQVEFLQKDTDGYNYKYVSEDKVLFAIKETMNEHQVLLVPSVVNHSVIPHTYKNSYGKEVTENIVKGDMIFTWYDAESEEELVVPFALYGQQGDASQAFGSGLTYSNRYFLLKFFQVATNETDPDKVVSKKRKQEDKKYTELDRKKKNLLDKMKIECPVKETRHKAYIKTMQDLDFDKWDNVHFDIISDKVFLGTFIDNVKVLENENN